MSKEPKWIAEEEQRVKRLPPSEIDSTSHDTKRWRDKTGFPVGLPTQQKKRKG